MLRPYQEEAINSTINSLSNGLNPLIIMPTGTGKTHVFSHLIKQLPGNHLILAHTRELIIQAQNSIFKNTGISSSIEMAEEKRLFATKSVIGSVQSMVRRLDRFRGVFKYIITDEAHRSTANSYKKIYEKWTDSQRMGFTATPDRADDKNLAEIYDTIAYQYSMADAIKDGWLVNIKAKRVTDFEIDISKLKVKYGDFEDGSLGDVLENYIVPISNSIVTQMENKKSLVFMPNVKSSTLLAKALENKGAKVAALHGKLTVWQRKSILLKFKRGEIQYLVSCQILIEGYDEPSIEGIVMLRPTQSRGLYAQAVGRGTRLYEKKDHLLLLEFTYNYRSLKLVKPYELFTASGIEERVQEAAKKIREEPVDLLQSLEDAQKGYYSIDRMLKSIIKKDVQHSFVEFDPLTVADFLKVDYYNEIPVSYNGKELEGPITEPQKTLLMRYNFEAIDKLTKSQASRIITGLKEKQLFPLVGNISEKQKYFLQKRGVETKGVTKAQASVLIQMIKEKKLSHQEQL